MTLLLVAERLPWERSRNAWLIGCGELLGGVTAATRGTTRPNAQVEYQEDLSEQPSEHSEQRPEAPISVTAQYAEVSAWYEEVGNVLWCQVAVEGEHDAEGQPLVEYEDLLSGDVLDLTQQQEPEHYWYW